MMISFPTNLRTSTGGNAAGDSGKLVVFGPSGELSPAHVFTGDIILQQIQLQGGAEAVTITGSFSTDRTLTIPDASGTLALTGTNAQAAAGTDTTYAVTPAGLSNYDRQNIWQIVDWDQAGGGTMSGATAAKRTQNSTGVEIVYLSSTATGTTRHCQLASYTAFPASLPLPGSRGGGATSSLSNATVNWNRPWRMTWVGTFAAGDNGNQLDLQIGVDPGILTTALAAKGVRIRWASAGTGASSCTISVIAHNGTSEITGAVTSTMAADRYDLDAYVLEWVPGTGFSLYRNGTLAASCTGGLPSGTGAAGAATLSALVTHVNVSNSLPSVLSLQSMRVQWL